MNSIERIGIGTVVLSLGWAAGCASTVEVAEPSGEGRTEGDEEAPVERHSPSDTLPSRNEPVVLVGGLIAPAGIAVDARSVYVTHRGTDPSAPAGVVDEILKEDGQRTPLAHSQRVPRGIAVTPDAVYWTESLSGDGTLMRVELDGGAPSIFVDGLAEPTALLLHRGLLFLATGEGLSSVSPSAPTLEPVLGSSFASSATTSIAADDDAVYYPWELTRVPLDGSPSTPLGPGWVATGLASDGDFLYATAGTIYANGAYALLRVRIVDGETDVLLDGLHQGQGVAVDGKWLYWVERGTYEAHMEDGTVRRMLKSGGPGAVVAENQTSPTAVVLDDQAVFWLNSGHPAEADGAVMRASK